MSVLENLSHLKQRIYTAARRAGRDPGRIKLVAVTKSVPVEVIKEALECGITSLGENKAQEFLCKYPLLPSSLDWHFIGRLQTNKVKKIVGKINLIHSLDRWPLAMEINRAACEAGIVAKVLIQVNMAGELTKQGLSPLEADDFVRDAGCLPGLELRGLMTIAPECENPEEVRSVFRQTRELARRLSGIHHMINMDFLSMGMTGDFEVALEEGANILRVGTAIFRKKY